MASTTCGAEEMEVRLRGSTGRMGRRLAPAGGTAGRAMITAWEVAGCRSRVGCVREMQDVGDHGARKVPGGRARGHRRRRAREIGRAHV